MAHTKKLNGLKYLEWYLENTRQDFLACPFQISEAKDAIERIEALQSNVSGNLTGIYAFALANQYNPHPEIAAEHRNAAREAARLLRAANRPVPEVIFI